MADNEKYACGYKNSQTGEIVYYKDKDVRSQLKEIEYSKADKNEVFTMANMGQDIKEAMTGGSVAVVGKNTILTDNIVDEQVTPYKTNFVEYGNNILDNTNLVGGYVYSNGEIKNGDYVTTTYIPFSKGDKINLSRMDNPTQNTNITRRAIRTACFYDSSYNVLTDYYYDNGALTKESITYQGEGNVAYIRVSFQKILVDNAMLYLGEERTEYEKNGVIINKLKLNENLKEEIETKIKIDNNVLKDKTIINFGDSIGAGDGNNGVGYAELLAKKNDMTCYDYAVGGATITTSTNDILTQIEKAKNDKKTADYILFDGFTNDINNGAVKELGKISDGYSQTKDINTFSGAFEEICFRLKSYWKGIPIFYVCVHKMSSRDTELQNTYSTRAKTLCERWSIPVIDIYREGGLNTYIADYKTLYTNNADGTHPNELGYNTFYVPLIEKNLKGGITSSANIKADNIKIEDVNNNFTSTNVEGALEEVSAQCKDIANEINDLKNNQNSTTVAIKDIFANNELPRIYMTSDKLGTLSSKNDEADCECEMKINNKTIKCYATGKVQGTTSANFPGKNFTFKFYADSTHLTKQKIDVGWGKQYKYCFKKNWVDSTHTRNLSGARIAKDMVDSRPASNFKTNLQTAPCNGVVDGFPCKLYLNGEFWGLYTWNIPKDDWMFNMDSDNPNHMVLCAEYNNAGTLTSNYVLQCEFRKPWAGSAWSVEVGTESTELTNSFNRCVNFVINSTDQEFHDNISDYFDLYSLLDYYLFAYFTCHYDGLGKNLLMATYDGVHWGAILYDMDSIYGATYNGGSFMSPEIKCPSEYQETNSLLWERIETCFIDELKARYKELRQGALSLGNIITHVEEIYDLIPDRVFSDDFEKWSIPSQKTNTMTRFRNYMRDRAVYVDNCINNLVKPISCTGITLDNTSLEFTTSDTQTLTATVIPSDTTDSIIWSVDNSTIATVVGGVVTPISNGSCIITATCGTQTATCNVIVSGITTRYNITNNLTNVTNSNSATSIEENSTYVGTLTANEGYTLSSIVITMGGTDITSSVYSDGNINIESVTGDVVITANADNVTLVETGNMIAGAWNSSVPPAHYETTKEMKPENSYIPIEMGKTYRIVLSDNTINSNSNAHYYDKDKTTLLPSNSMEGNLNFKIVNGVAEFIISSFDTSSSEALTGKEPGYFNFRVITGSILDNLTYSVYQVN